MMEIIIDEEFKSLLPALDEETYRLLTENIIEHGCRDPLVLWNGILIDGYNRYKICSEHDIPYGTVDKEFDSREEVLIWIITNQISRRNLSPLQLSHFRGLHYKADKKIRGTNNRFSQQSKKSQNETFYSGGTSGRLADQYKVSRNTIFRDEKLSEAISLIGDISPEAKRKILSGEVLVNKSKLESLPSAPREEAEAIAAEIAEGKYKRRAARSAVQTEAESGSASVLPEIKKLNMIIRNFANNFDAMLREQSNSGALELKPVLRSYIDQLEDLYHSM
jgi:hypothetical protein